MRSPPASKSDTVEDRKHRLQKVDDVERRHAPDQDGEQAGKGGVGDEVGSQADDQPGQQQVGGDAGDVVGPAEDLGDRDGQPEAEHPAGQRDQRRDGADEPVAVPLEPVEMKRGRPLPVYPSGEAVLQGSRQQPGGRASEDDGRDLDEVGRGEEVEEPVPGLHQMPPDGLVVAEAPHAQSLSVRQREISKVPEIVT